MARNNVEFELKAVEVDVYDLEILDYSKNILTLKIDCGSGTYVRSIGRDIANSLNSLACMIELERIKVGNFDIKDCYEINDITKENLKIVEIDKVLDFPTLNLSDDDVFKLLNGQTKKIDEKDGLYFIKQTNKIIAIVEIKNLIAKMSIFLD